jgi:protein-S-isoprenylcysteine O-methyltransferase Ste14
MTSAAPWNRAAGDFFFRVRNAVFPALVVLIPLFSRPRLYFNDPALDALLRHLGVALALAGAGVRLATIGFEYIDRGGKEGKVHATRLVRSGLYGISRNPMYVGNLLIAVGVSLASGALLTCWVAIPLFVFIYQAIVTAEEAFLLGKFGEDYARYCREVNRFWPSWQRLPEAFRGLTYDWRKALRKDLGTLLGLIEGLMALAIWRRVWLRGRLALPQELPTLALMGLVLAVYVAAHALKKQRKFFYTPEESRTTV